jgi:two-component sensor histidine kinase
VVLAKYDFQRGDLQKGIDLFYVNIKEYQAAGNKESEARCWSMLAGNIPMTFATKALKLKADSNAMRLYEDANKHEDALYSLEDLADATWQVGRFEDADKEQTRVVEGLLALGKKMYTHYARHAVYDLYLGDHARALDNLFKAKANMDSLKEDYLAGPIDKYLGNVYWAEQDLDRSLYWYKISLAETQGRKDKTIYGTVLRIGEALTFQHKLTGAQQFLTDFERNNPAIRNRDKELMAAAWGNLYEYLHRWGDAEKSYWEMIRLDSLAVIDQARDIEEEYDVARPEANFMMGNFYVDIRQFSKARPFLEKALTPQSVVPITIDIIRDVHFLLYRVDSAAGDFRLAFKHRFIFERLVDSTFSADKVRELAELQVRYESDKKDQNIALLSKERQLDMNELSRDALLRNITFGGLLAALVIIGLLYNQYWVKRKNGKAIELKNETLSQLVKEKEWLLREVHHRVKNSLQTVVSLLDSQTAYLSADALTAIQDSQNRVFSISLIHQKLYQDDDVARVNIASYLGDLVRYLRDIYGIKTQISFQLDIVPVMLDISQAVSIGLILNEALTNAIKHAFPKRSKANVVVIRMSVGEKDIVDLAISDNGVGLAPEMESGSRGSLGLKLMRGLTDDLGGSFSITSNQGTAICVRFVVNVSWENAREILKSDKTAGRI